MKIIKFNNELVNKINHIAIPLILNSVTGMVIGLCDQAMIGHISLEAFGAVGLIASTVNSITGVLGMTCVAFNIMGARLKGEGNYGELKSQLILHFVIDLLIGMVFFLVTLLAGKFLLSSLYNLKGETLSLSVDYLDTFSLSLGINMILFTFSSYFKIVGKTRYIFYANLISSIANVIFDYILIFGKLGFPKMGARGNAIGSVLALVLGCKIYILAISKDKICRLKYRISFRSIKSIAKVSLPLMGQEVLEATVIVISINSILSRVGITEVSLYNLLFSIVGISLMPMYAYSQTSLTLISEGIGAGDEKGIRKIPKACTWLALAIYSGISIIIMMLIRNIAGVITNDVVLISGATRFLPLAIGISAIYIPATVLKYTLQGMGKEGWVFITSTIVNLGGIGAIFILAGIGKLGLNGIYFGLGLNYVMLIICYFYKYRKATLRPLG